MLARDPMAIPSIRLIFYDSVNHIPTNEFQEQIPLCFTGADVKNRIAVVEKRDPTRYTLFTSTGLRVDMYMSLSQQGITTGDYLKAVPS